MRPGGAQLAKGLTFRDLASLYVDQKRTLLQDALSDGIPQRAELDARTDRSKRAQLEAGATRGEVVALTVQ